MNRAVMGLLGTLSHCVRVDEFHRFAGTGADSP